MIFKDLLNISIVKCYILYLIISLKTIDLRMNQSHSTHMGHRVSMVSRNMLDCYSIVLTFIFHSPGPLADCEISSFKLTVS